MTGEGSVQPGAAGGEGVARAGPPGSGASRPTPPANPGGVELAPGVMVAAGAVRFAFSRSGGPGGQNVNKVSSKAELRVGLADLPLTERALARLAALAGRRAVGGGEGGAAEVVIVSESERSQGRNRAECLEKLRELIVRAMVEPKRRKKTKPSRGAVERRIKAKKERGDVKRGRRQDAE